MALPTIEELRDRAAVLVTELTELRSVEEPTEDQVTRLDEIVAEIPTLRSEIEKTEARNAAIEEVRAMAALPGHVEKGTPNVIVKPSEDDIYDRSQMRVENDADGVKYRDNALRAIEGWRSSPDEYKESASKLVDGADMSKRERQIADYILDAGHPLYVKAFNKFIRGGPAVLPLLSREEAQMFAHVNDPSRAINEGSTSAGQALVPPYLDPSIILTNNGTENPFRQLATVKTIATQTWKGVTSAGVSAEWTGEAAEVTDASPTFSQPSITPIRADAYIEASFESFEDTDLATELAMLFADARDNLEGTAFAVGTGSTQPYGVVTELQLVTTSRTAATTNGTLGVPDVFALSTNLPPRFQAGASYVAARGIQNVLRSLATGTAPAQAAFWVDLGGGLPSVLAGYPIHLASAMQATLSVATASSDDVLILGNFKRGMTIVDRVGMSVVYEPLVKGANRRPIGSVGWAAFWRVGSRVTVPQAFQMLRV